MAEGISELGDGAAPPDRDDERLFDREWLERVFNGLTVMYRVIFAVVMRETRTRYGSSDIGYTWAIIDPLIELAILVIIFTSFGRHSPVEASLPVFLTTGILTYGFWRNCMSRGSSAAAGNQALLTYPQVKVADIIIGRVVLEAVTSVVVYLVFMIGLLMITGEPLASWFDEPLQMCLALLMLGYFGMAAGFFNAGLTRILPIWGNIWSYLSRPLWFLSGIFYTLESLPHGARHYMQYNPIAHSIEWVRSASLPGFESTHYSPGFIFMAATVMLVIGMAIDRVLITIGQNSWES